MKRPHRRQLLHLAVGAAVLPVGSRFASAQPYPTRPITIIVPYPAGGGADAVTRILAEPMRTLLGQTVVIENVAGASGSIGTGRVARAAPDGYTLGIGNWSTHVANGAMYALPYNVVSDFEPVALHQVFYLILVVKKELPADSLKELISWLKAKPGKASAGTIGVGGQGHLAGILFQNLTGARFQHVPYRGNALAMQDLIAGQIDLIFADPTAVAQVRAGSVKAFAVTADHRLSAVPEIPTAAETGLAEFVLANWNGLFAPKGTPKDVIGRLNAAVSNALTDARVIQQLVALGSEIPSPEQRTPEAISALQKAEIEKWWPIIKAANLKVE